MPESRAELLERKCIMDHHPGDHVIVTTDSLGVFARECWTPETGQLTARLFFDPDVTASAGDEATLLVADPREDQAGWWLANYRGYVLPIHESMMTPAESWTRP